MDYLSVFTMKYYDHIAKGYNELHGAEQEAKLEIIIHDVQKIKGFILEKDKILDVGCGTGISSTIWNKLGLEVVGVDPSEELLKIAKKDYPNIKFVEAIAESLPFEDGAFDVVVSITALQNFEDLEKGLGEIKRVGKSKFILSTLKKSPRLEEIKEKVIKVFLPKKIIIEDKDIVFVCY